MRILTLGNVIVNFTTGRALIVGVANYLHVRKLPNAVLDDARDMAELLRNVAYCGYSPSNVKLLLDSAATLEGIRTALNKVVQESVGNETVVIYFSGHGGRTDSCEYLIPYDFDPNDIEGTGLGEAEVTKLLNAIKAERIVILLDACHSSGTAELKVLDPAESVKVGVSEKTYNSLAQGNGRVMMASCRANEVSAILPGMRNSLFTHYLLDALRGRASTEEVVRVFEVFQYVSDKVPTDRSDQHPVFKAHNLENNFPLALRLGGKAAARLDSVSAPVIRPLSLSGKTKIALLSRLVDRWKLLATYFEIPMSDQATFQKGHEPQHIFEWLEQRNRLAELRDAFNYLSWDDLIEELDRYPQ